MKLFLAFALVLGTTSAEFNSSGAVGPELVNEGRVYNGIYAIPFQFPYQVGLKTYETKSDVYYCGGSLISMKWVLTAAHCLTDVEKVKIYFGTLVRGVSKRMMSVKKSRIFIHPKFSLTQKGNDIGLIMIPAVKLCAGIQTVRLPSIASTYSLYEGEAAILSGWGKRIGDPVENLKWGSMTVMSNQECREIYGDEISDSRLCVASADGAHMCQGDSGGPLVLRSNRILIGIASEIDILDCSNGPSIYTRVTSHLEWIKSISGISH